MVEAGVDFRFVKPEIDFKISNLKGVVYSHGHLDHSKAVPDILNYSIPVYSSKEAIEATGIKNRNLIAVEEYKSFSVGEFKIKPFPLSHDVKCFGFLIKHPEMGITAFITDTYYVPNKFKGLNHLLVEVNYSKEILDYNIQIQARRVLSSHMELETTKEMLRANDLSHVANIVLIHLSDANSNARNFKQEIESVTGRPVFVADKGLNISLNKGGF